MEIPDQFWYKPLSLTSNGKQLWRKKLR